MLKILKFKLLRVINVLVLYYIYGMSGSSLLTVFQLYIYDIADHFDVFTMPGPSIALQINWVC